MRFAVATSLLLLLLPRPGSAQEGPLTVTVNAIDQTTGLPVEGVVLRLVELQIGHGRTRRATTGASGQVVFSGLSPGAHQIILLSAPRQYAEEQFSKMELTGSRLVELTMAPAGRISGQVVLADGFAGPAAVQVQQLRTGGVFIARSVEVGPDGAFDFKQLNARFPVVVSARAPGAHGRQIVVQPKIPAGTDSDGEDGFVKGRKLSFTLVPYDASATSIQGVVSRAGLPVDGLGLAIVSTTPVDGAFWSAMAVTAKGGKYTVPQLPSGTYRVFANDTTGTMDPNNPPIRIVDVVAGGLVVADFALAP